MKLTIKTVSPFSVLFRILFFLLPLTLLPIAPDIQDHSALFLVTVFSCLAVVFFAITAAKKRSFIYVHSPFTLPFFAIVCLFALSTGIQTDSLPTFIESFSLTTLLSTFLLYIVLIHEMDKDEKGVLMNHMEASTIAVCLYTLFVLARDYFTGTTTYIFHLQHLTLFISVLALFSFFSFIQKRLVLHFFSTVLTLLSSGFLLHRLLTIQKPLVLPFSIGFPILFEAFHTVQTALLGVGPTRFISAYALFRPAAVNQTQYWNAMFSASSSFFLTLLTETGLLSGLVFAGITIYTCIAMFKNRRERLYLVFLAIMLLISIVLPINTHVWVLIVLFMVFASRRSIAFRLSFKRFYWIGYIVSFIMVVFAVFILYTATRFYLAELLYKQSLTDVIARNGTQAYNKQTRAVSYNGSSDKYHVALSQTSLLLATTVGQGENQTEEQTHMIALFAQESIEEAKAAVRINKMNPINWSTLARTYGSLTQYASGSAQWAQQSYQALIALDRVSPLYRVELGQIYATTGRYQEAIDVFQQALSLKPDLVSAHFNLGLTYGAMGNKTEAIRTLENAKRLVPDDSEDARRIKEEIAKVNEK